MPLPNYNTRSDSFGNYYFGGFQVDSQVEAGYGAGTALTATQSDFNLFLNSALGVGNWAVNGNNYYFRFNNPYEQLTDAVTTTANWRFSSVPVSGLINSLSINTAPTGSVVSLTSSQNFNNSFIYSSTRCAYAVANQYGMWVCYASKGSTSGTLSTDVSSSYFGWVKDPVFPTNTTERVRNLIVGMGTSSTSAFLSTRAPSVSNVPSNCITNSVITCSVATQGANITDLCVLDPNNSYLNIGSTYNGLFYPGTGLTVGQIYRIPPAQDPDGNTEQNIWLCAGQVYGWNGTTGVANAGYKLIRVWSNNIT